MTESSPRRGGPGFRPHPDGVFPQAIGLRIEAEASGASPQILAQGLEVRGFGHAGPKLARSIRIVIQVAIASGIRDLETSCSARPAVEHGCPRISALTRARARAETVFVETRESERE